MGALRPPPDPLPLKKKPEPPTTRIPESAPTNHMYLSARKVFQFQERIVQFDITIYFYFNPHDHHTCHDEASFSGLRPMTVKETGIIKTLQTTDSVSTIIFASQGRRKAHLLVLREEERIITIG